MGLGKNESAWKSNVVPNTLSSPFTSLLRISSFSLSSSLYSIKHQVSLFSMLKSNQICFSNPVLPSSHINHGSLP